jgi:hypothetical protein
VDMPPDEIGKAFDQAETFTPEPPRPLVRDRPPPDPFPVDALGPLLGAAARGIQDKTQAPLAICGSSVLAASSLAAQAHADVELPTGQRKPLSLFCVSVAASGERKSTVDGQALSPVRRREAALVEQYDADLPAYVNAQTAWDQARKHIMMKNKKHGRAAIQSALDDLGPAPAAPLVPLLTCEEPTLEGLIKLLAAGQPSVGIFSAEGGLFMGGHAMSEEARLRSAAGLSTLWDGEPLRRVRVSDGATILRRRRVSLHLMAQPDVASGFLTDPVLADQGLLGRVLVTAPETTAGTRFYRDASPGADAAVRRYGARLLALLERPLPLAEGKSNELAPRALTMSAEARGVWIEFSDHIEALIGPGGELETVRALANKAAEHAGRMAGVRRREKVPPGRHEERAP